LWVAALLSPRLCAQTTPEQGTFPDLLRRAFEAHQRSDYATALPLLLQAHTLQPHDYFANLLLGVERLRTGEAAKAVALLREAARAKPGEEFPHEYLGEVYATLGQYGDAESEYSRALHVQPGSTEAATLLIDFALERYRQLSEILRSSAPGLAEVYRLQAATHRPADAERIALLQHAIAVKSSQPGLWSELALAEVAAGDWDAAKTSVEKALQANSDDLRAHQAKAMFLANQAQWPAAVAEVRAIASRSKAAGKKTVDAWPEAIVPDASVKLSPSDRAAADCLRNRVLTCFIGKDLNGTVTGDEAKFFREQRWERVVALHPPIANESAKWLRRGLAFIELENYGEAIPAIERGISASPRDAYAIARLSIGYAARASEVAEVLQNSENRAAVHIVRGDLLLRLQANASAAEREYQQALPDHDSDPALWERIAEAQLAAGEMDPAKTSAATALRFDPHRVSPTRTLAKVAMEERAYDTALPYLHDLVARDPRDLASQVELATACAETGANEEALHYLAPLLEQGYPDEKGSLHYLLGRVLRKLKQPEQASVAFAQAQKLSEQFQATSRSEK
jgi:tetratricopeptide (TPR) repeat protein